MVCNAFKKSLVTVLLAMFVAVSLDVAKASRTTERDERVFMNQDASRVKTHLRIKDHLSAMETHSWLAGSAPNHPANLADIVRQQRHILKKGNPATTCGDGDSFTITAPDASKIEGCYSEVVGCENAGEKTYSQTGTYDIGQTVVVAYKTDGSTSASSEELDLWLVAYRASPNPVEASVYCISIDTASDHHPSDVDTWYCDLDQDGDYVEATEADFDVDCGCH